MPAPLLIVHSFFTNADAYSEFLQRVTAALYEAALAIRAEATPDPVTGPWAARQRYALQVLAHPVDQAKRLLPGLALAANDAGLLSDLGVISATDTQIRATVANLIDTYAGYVPEVP